MTRQVALIPPCPTCGGEVTGIGYDAEPQRYWTAASRVIAAGGPKVEPCGHELTSEFMVRIVDEEDASCEDCGHPSGYHRTVTPGCRTRVDPPQPGDTNTNYLLSIEPAQCPCAGFMFLGQRLDPVRSLNVSA